MVRHIQQSLKESLHHFDYQLTDSTDDGDLFKKLRMPFELLNEFERMEFGVVDED